MCYSRLWRTLSGYARSRSLSLRFAGRYGCSRFVDVVDANDIWIVANYKETQTANIREGQSVEIEVDAVPGIRFEGVVKSISRATGASFSLFPQDNSAGNFVKVEQRIPLRIEFTGKNNKADLERLRAGMNVECEVKY